MPQARKFKLLADREGNRQIKACGDAGDVHGSMLAFDSLCDRNVGSWNILLAAYARSGHLSEAFVVFSIMPWRDTASWNTMIGAFARSENEARALDFFWDMISQEIDIDRISITAALKACLDLADVERVYDVVAAVPELDSCLIVRTSFVKSYSIHHFSKAKQIFDRSSRRDVVLWTAMIYAYAEVGHIVPARRLFSSMPHYNTVSWNVMLTFFAQLGKYEEAIEMLERMPESSCVAWNVLITAYAQSGHLLEAVKTFCCMSLEGLAPVQATYLGVLGAISQSRDLRLGKTVHAEIDLGIFCNSTEIKSSLIDMYVKCGCLDAARDLIDRTSRVYVGSSSWNAMIGGYTRSGYLSEAFDLFKRMDLEGIEINRVTILSILPACRSLSETTVVHSALSSKFPCMESMAGIGSELINVYGKHGGVQDAARIFDKVPRCDRSSWTALIGGNARNGHEEAAVRIWRRMDLEATAAS